MHCPLHAQLFAQRLNVSLSTPPRPHAPLLAFALKGPAILTNSWTDEGQQALSTGVASSVALQAANAALLSYRNALVSAGALDLSLFR